jgi:hypothetical protein
MKLSSQKDSSKVSSIRGFNVRFSQRNHEIEASKIKEEAGFLVTCSKTSTIVLKDKFKNTIKRGNVDKSIFDLLKARSVLPIAGFRIEILSEILKENDDSHKRVGNVPKKTKDKINLQSRESSSFNYTKPNKVDVGVNVPSSSSSSVASKIVDETAKPLKAALSSDSSSGNGRQPSNGYSSGGSTAKLNEDSAQPSSSSNSSNSSSSSWLDPQLERVMRPHQLQAAEFLLNCLKGKGGTMIDN